MDKKIEYIKADNIYYDKEGNYYLLDNGNYRYIINITIKEQNNGNS